MAFSLDAAVSMFDPSSASAPLGGLTREALGSIPGASTALGFLDTYQANVPSSVPTATQRPPAPAPSTSWSSIATRPAVIVVGLVVAAGLALVLVFRRK